MVVARSWGEPSETPRSEPGLMIFHCCRKWELQVPGTVQTLLWAFSLLIFIMALGGLGHVIACASDLGDHTYWNQKEAKRFPDVHAKGFFAEFCEVPPSSMEYLFRRLQEDPFFNNPSNTQALQFSTTRTQATQFAIPSEKLKCGASLFKKSWGISRWLQKSVKLSVGPFWAGGPVWLHRSHPGEVCPANSIFPW